MYPEGSPLEIGHCSLFFDPRKKGEEDGGLPREGGEGRREHGILPAVEIILREARLFGSDAEEEDGPLLFLPQGSLKIGHGGGRGKDRKKIGRPGAPVEEEIISSRKGFSGVEGLSDRGIRTDEGHGDFRPREEARSSQDLGGIQSRPLKKGLKVKKLLLPGRLDRQREGLQGLFLCTLPGGQDHAVPPGQHAGGLSQIDQGGMAVAGGLPEP